MPSVPPDFYEKKSFMFLEYVKELGDIEEARHYADLNKSTYDKWLDTKPDFNPRIEAALLHFRDTIPLVLKNEAKRQLANYVFGRMQRVHSRIIYKFDSQGNQIEKQEIVNTESLGVPQWAIERVLGKDNITEVDALIKLADSGLLPRTLTDRAIAALESSKEDVQKLFTEYYPDQQTETIGLTDATANTIKAHILGIAEEPAIEVIVEPKE